MGRWNRYSHLSQSGNGHCPQQAWGHCFSYQVFIREWRGICARVIGLAEIQQGPCWYGKCSTNTVKQWAKMVMVRVLQECKRSCIDKHNDTELQWWCLLCAQAWKSWITSHSHCLTVISHTFVLLIWSSGSQIQSDPIQIHYGKLLHSYPVYIMLHTA